MDQTLFKLWLGKHFLKSNFYINELLEGFSKDYIETNRENIKIILSPDSTFRIQKINQSLSEDQIAMLNIQIKMLLTDDFLNILNPYVSYKQNKQCILDFIKRYETQELDRLYKELKPYFPDLNTAHGTFTKRGI